jgi:hypothetical protein
MRLLWDIYPDAAKRLTRAFAAGCSLVYSFHNIHSEDDVELFLYFSDFISENFNAPAEEYMIYSDVDDAMDAYIAAAQWLDVYEIPERYMVFMLLTEFVIWYEFYDTILRMQNYDPTKMDELRGLIDFFGAWLFIPPEEIHEFASKTFQKVKQKTVEMSQG